MKKPQQQTPCVLSVEMIDGVKVTQVEAQQPPQGITAARSDGYYAISYCVNPEGRGIHQVSGNGLRKLPIGIF